MRDVEKKESRQSDMSRRKKVIASAIVIVLVIAVILSMIWLDGNDDGPFFGSIDDDLFSLSQAEGGVKCTILRDTSWSWNYTTVQIELQGYDSACWNLCYTNLSTGSWIVDAGDVQLLGDTFLRLHIVEAEGDGRIGQGDAIVVSPLDSAEFLQDEVYRFALTRGNLAISGTEYWMNFWFEDGDFETGPMEMIHIPL